MDLKGKISYDSESAGMSLTLSDISIPEKEDAKRYLNNLSYIGRSLGEENTEYFRTLLEKNPGLGQHLQLLVNADGSFNSVLLGQLIDNGTINVES